jgi:hypothetical protein
LKTRSGAQVRQARQAQGLRSAQPLEKEYDYFLGRTINKFNKLLIQANNGYEVQYQPPKTVVGKYTFLLDGGPIALSKHGRPFIYLGPRFFVDRGQATPVWEKTDTIIHELSHIALDTKDHKGDWNNDPERIIDDAYWFGAFSSTGSVSADVDHQLRALQDVVWSTKYAQRVSERGYVGERPRYYGKVGSGAELKEYREARREEIAEIRSQLQNYTGEK